jgi:hypothetical protein
MKNIFVKNKFNASQTARLRKPPYCFESSSVSLVKAFNSFIQRIITVVTVKIPVIPVSMHRSASMIASDI